MGGYLQMGKEGAASVDWPLAVPSAHHCRAVVVGSCTAVWSEISVLAEPSYEQGGEGRDESDWVAAVQVIGAELRESITHCLSSAPAGELLLLQQVRFLAEVQYCTNFPREGRERGGESRIEEEPPRPRLPLDISLTAARKELERADLLFPIQEQWLLCTNFYTNNSSRHWLYCTQTSPQKLVFVLDTM